MEYSYFFTPLNQTNQYEKVYETGEREVDYIG